MTLMLLAGMVQEAEHAGPVSPFEVNFGLFIWTWAVFLLLMWMLKKFAFPAILRVTEEREQGIQRQLSEAEKANTEAKSLLEENKRQLAKARAEAQALMAEVKVMAEKERATALEKTRHEQEALLDRARRDITEEREKAIADLRREAVDLSLAAAARLVEQRFDADADRAFVQGYINSLGEEQLRPVTIARNYAEALFQLGEQSGHTALYADLLDAVAYAIGSTPRIEAVLMSPRITKAEKSRILAKALPDAPRDFVLFLQAVVKRGRQRLFGDMASEYLALVDIKLDRVRAKVTIAREADEKLRKKIAEDLTKAIGKQVLPDFEVEPAILGGVIVRVGDRVYDGSVRRRLVRLRRQLLAR